MICNICNTDFSSNRGLSIHIVRTHNITLQQYYDTYYKKYNDGSCLHCNKTTIFLGLTKGYRKFCSKTCCNKSKYHQLKMQNTIISKYGGMGTASKIINEKIKSTNMEKYGSENVYSSEYGKNEIKNSNLKRFGVEYAFQSAIVKNKIIQTSLYRYNTTNPGNSKLARQKAARTRRDSENESSWEDYFENNLNSLDISYEKQYNSDTRYPYLCDFYLPDTDTFIEINGYWSHNDHWFDSNSDVDKNKLDLWISKANAGHAQYKNAINVWTVRNIQKRDIAIKNNLNYIVLWKFDDMVKFFTDTIHILRKDN